MKTLKLVTSHNTTAAILLCVLTIISPLAMADTNRVCKEETPSDCIIIAKVPLDIQEAAGILSPRDAWELRFTDGEWSLNAQPIVSFGSAGWTPVVGDWDGDGYDNIGVHKGSVWIFKNTWITDEPGDVVVRMYGDGSYAPVVGDWNNDGKDSLGLYKDGHFKIRFDSDDPNSEQIIDFGYLPNPTESSSGVLPIAGSFDEQADRVGIIEGDKAIYAAVTTTAVYNHYASTDGLVVRVVPEKSEDLFPLVINTKSIPSVSDQREAALVFRKRPQDFFTFTPCPSGFVCAFLDLEAIRPDDGGNTVIPVPNVF